MSDGYEKDEKVEVVAEREVSCGGEWLWKGEKRCDEIVKGGEEGRDERLKKWVSGSECERWKEEDEMRGIREEEELVK